MTINTIRNTTTRSLKIGHPSNYGPVWLWLKAGSGPDSAEATENTEWVRTEFTENYDFSIPGFSSVTG